MGAGHSAEHGGGGGGGLLCDGGRRSAASRNQREREEIIARRAGRSSPHLTSADIADAARARSVPPAPRRASACSSGAWGSDVRRYKWESRDRDPLPSPPSASVALQPQAGCAACAFASGDRPPSPPTAFDRRMSASMASSRSRGGGLEQMPPAVLLPTSGPTPTLPASSSAAAAALLAGTAVAGGGVAATVSSSASTAPFGPFAFASGGSVLTPPALLTSLDIPLVPGSGSDTTASLGALRDASAPPPAGSASQAPWWFTAPGGASDPGAAANLGLSLGAPASATAVPAVAASPWTEGSPPPWNMASVDITGTPEGGQFGALPVVVAGCGGGGLVSGPAGAMMRARSVPARIWDGRESYDPSGLEDDLGGCPAAAWRNVGVNADREELEDISRRVTDVLCRCQAVLSRAPPQALPGACGATVGLPSAAGAAVVAPSAGVGLGDLGRLGHQWASLQRELEEARGYGAAFYNTPGQRHDRCGSPASAALAAPLCYSAPADASRALSSGCGQPGRSLRHQRHGRLASETDDEAPAPSESSCSQGNHGAGRRGIAEGAAGGNSAVAAILAAAARPCVDSTSAILEAIEGACDDASGKHAGTSRGDATCSTTASTTLLGRPAMRGVGDGDGDVGVGHEGGRGGGVALRRASEAGAAAEAEVEAELLRSAGASRTPSIQSGMDQAAAAATAAAVAVAPLPSHVRHFDEQVDRHCAALEMQMARLAALRAATSVREREDRLSTLGPKSTSRRRSHELRDPSAGGRAGEAGACAALAAAAEVAANARGASVRASSRKRRESRTHSHGHHDHASGHGHVHGRGHAGSHRSRSQARDQGHGHQAHESSYVAVPGGGLLGDLYATPPQLQQPILYGHGFGEGVYVGSGARLANC
eukprot:TRINITY_DN2604_c0_g2_i2.p1 TRINITY_DN2604_c0_g2~~TRINITY_DN2604_c0_g2_i2.p1  ORF type:complete len:884 (+),score=150.57 TRINITY_DN2604_c0_g2_i2:221-2872(+)